MSVGGRIIENTLHTFTDDGKSYTRRRLWTVDRQGDECAVFVEDTPEAASLKPGETAWWQSGIIYARDDTLKLKKIGFSFDPSFKDKS
jgi:hypothetical protein